ncbi:VOC family protein [Vibrio hannami]|uniref:VOC family protein n=1 Tax=Vibrio hannami TaxID=2717094 RepID=UPI00241032C2|nr:VOC family protein [Vibrio hannami]MDG3087979.1 VOC family protein [Vibrio hannami]
MQGNPVGWFEIYVDDLSRAKSFYETVMAVKLEEIESPKGADLVMLGFPSSMESYGASGAIAKMEGVKAGGNSTMVYFSCEDCAVEESRVEGAGGKVISSKFSIGPYGYISVLLDTEGNTIGLHSML